MSDENATGRRKDSHLDLCATEEVEPQENSTLLECVKLFHCAMPEMQLSDVDLSVTLLGKRLKAPLLVTGMTGGSDRAEKVNRDLAVAAEACGVAFGVGSQRAMAEDESKAKSYQVRQVAPNTVLIGNIGLQQATQMGVDKVRRLVDSIAADGIAIHLNPGQELTQPEGDRDFRAGYSTLAALVQAFGDRLVVKETGCGIGADVALRLQQIGVKNIDVSGLGGTSWVRVEQLRATGLQYELGRQFSNWGIPTAAAVSSVRRAVGAGVCLIASGGLRTGLDLARAIALGADLGGMALPLFKAQQMGGTPAVIEAIDTVQVALKQAFLLTGSKTASELKAKPKVIGGELKDWLAPM